MLLSFILFLPLLGALLALIFRRSPEACRWSSLGIALLDLCLVVSLFGLDLQPQSGPVGKWLLSEDAQWISRFGIRYSLGLDGISLMLILLTAFLTVLCILVSWRQITDRVGAFHFFLLCMETGVLGVFLAVDLFLFYLFWEFQIVPMFFLIGMWGHERRTYATVKFILYTLFGSLLMLVALVALYLQHGAQTGQYTFALNLLVRTKLSGTAEFWIYSAFLLAFLIKIPVFPVHSWLPDAHPEAPTAGSVILAGLLLKTGAYALIRFGFPIFPAAARHSVPLLLVVGLVGLFYAAWIALSQRDLKRLVAYSSIAHMGIVVIGIAVWNSMTLSGAVLQMVNHGLTTSALFILVGMLDERTRSREIADFGGLWGKIPYFSGFFFLFSLASLGLPGLNNFVGEFLVLIGAFAQRPVVAGLGFAGLALTVVFVLRLVQGTLFGETRGVRIREAGIPDLSAREAAILIPLAAAVIFLGWYPRPVLDLFRGPVEGLVQFLK
jgi:NADH-quinone oxidoreductase subunit M